MGSALLVISCYHRYKTTPHRVSDVAWNPQLGDLRCSTTAWRYWTGFLFYVMVISIFFLGMTLNNGLLDRLIHYIQLDWMSGVSRPLVAALLLSVLLDLVPLAKTLDELLLRLTYRVALIPSGLRRLSAAIARLPYYIPDNAIIEQLADNTPYPTSVASPPEDWTDDYYKCSGIVWALEARAAHKPMPHKLQMLLNRTKEGVDGLRDMMRASMALESNGVETGRLGLRNRIAQETRYVKQTLYDIVAATILQATSAQTTIEPALRDIGFKPARPTMVNNNAVVVVAIVYALMFSLIALGLITGSRVEYWPLQVITTTSSVVAAVWLGTSLGMHTTRAPQQWGRYLIGALGAAFLALLVRTSLFGILFASESRKLHDVWMDQVAYCPTFILSSATALVAAMHVGHKMLSGDRRSDAALIFLNVIVMSVTGWSMSWFMTQLVDYQRARADLPHPLVFVGTCIAVGIVVRASRRYLVLRGAMQTTRFDDDLGLAA